jgi:serine/threonine protein kinase
MAWRLLVIDGADAGRAFPLSATGPVTIGNNHKHANICLHDLYVSRTHCQLDLVDGQVVVAAAGPAHPVMVNGHKLIDKQALHSGDVVRVGNSHLRLEAVKDAGEAPAPEEHRHALGELPHLTADKLEELSDYTLGHYELGPMIGKGHHSTAFKAMDTKTGLYVTLKVLPPEFPSDSKELEPFINAMRARLPMRHPHLVTLYGTGKTGPYCWIAREYMDGGTLSQRLASTPSGNWRDDELEWSGTDWRTVLRAAIQVAKALKFLHANQHFHGNITPDNILLSSDGMTAKLGNLLTLVALGNSKVERAARSARLKIEAPFMAPEQTETRSFVDGLSDIYGLGATLYAALTGRPPYQAATLAETVALIREGILPKPRKYHPSLPAAFDKVVPKMMARNQEDRYQTASELLVDLESIATAQKVAV